jgi:hypothetical protein
MFTPFCVIGLELPNEHVRWVYYMTDPCFSRICPILRTYENAADVKKLLDRGSREENELPLTAQQLAVSAERVADIPAETALSRYEFYDDEAHACRYIFTKDNKWVCHMPDYFDIANLSA